MTLTIRAHFDGKLIVPDEAVALPRDTPLTVHVEMLAVGAPVQPEQQRAVHDGFLASATARPVPHLADQALRRESIYEE